MSETTDETKKSRYAEVKKYKALWEQGVAEDGTPPRGPMFNEPAGYPWGRSHTMLFYEDGKYKSYELVDVGLEMSCPSAYHLSLSVSSEPEEKNEDPMNWKVSYTEFGGAESTCGRWKVVVYPNFGPDSDSPLNVPDWYKERFPET